MRVQSTRVQPVIMQKSSARDSHTTTVPHTPYHTCARAHRARSARRTRRYVATSAVVETYTAAYEVSAAAEDVQRLVEQSDKLSSFPARRGWHKSESQSSMRRHANRTFYRSGSPCRPRISFELHVCGSALDAVIGRLLCARQRQLTNRCVERGEQLLHFEAVLHHRSERTGTKNRQSEVSRRGYGSATDAIARLGVLSTISTVRCDIVALSGT